jgi:rhodanese-related sulfurtransferase
MKMGLFSKIFGPPVAAVEPREVANRMNGNGEQGKKPLLLDVRQPEEFRAGHIQGAKLVPLGDLRQRIKELPQDRQIICVCRSGNRSGSATRMLASAGYEVANMRGGMIGWMQSGLPVKKGM